jgi:hypothetical protein
VSKECERKALFKWDRVFCRFRVGHSTGLCLLDEKQRGRTFDEFNLIFYRTCALSTVETDENNAAINSAISVKTK